MDRKYPNAGREWPWPWVFPATQASASVLPALPLHHPSPSVYACAVSAQKPHVLVLGAGIGGLAAAVALRKAGCTFEIHERAPELRPVGAGLTVQPNAIMALRHLGVGDLVERSGQSLGLRGLSLADGTVLSHISPEEGRSLLAEVGAPVVGIHRATLHEILLEAAGRDRLHLGRTATRYELTESRAKLHFSDGSIIEADALIGADGIHSVCREQLLGDGEPVYSGYFAWRGIAPDRGALPSDWGAEVWGDGVRLGGCCIDGGRCYWFAVVNGPAGRKDEPGRSKAALLEAFRDFHDDLRALIASTPEEAMFRSDIADRKPVTTWGEGRMTLLGDAAHAMTPNLGQGACQAIEDALVLGLELHASNDVRVALRRYEKLRQPRANKVVEVAHTLGEIGQWENRGATFLRNGLFRLMPSSLMRARMAEAWKLPYGGFD